MRKPLCGIGFAVVLAALFCCLGLSAQEPDEPVAAGSVFEIGKDEVGLEDDFNVKPKVQATYTHPVTEKEGKASAKVVNKIGTKDPADTADCEWSKRIPLYDKKLLSTANKTATFTATWLAENADQNQPLALPLSLTSKQVPVNALGRTIHLSPPLIYDVEVGEAFITITGRWFGTKKPKVWFEYLNAKDQVKRLNCKVEKPDGEDGRVNAKGKPVYMNPADGTSKVVVQVPKLPKGVALKDLSHVVLDSGSGLAADTELYGVTFDLDGKGERIGGGALVQAVRHGQAAIAPEVEGNAGWRFVGWDVSFDNVIAPLTVTAQYVLLHLLSGTVSGDVAASVTVTLTGDAAMTMTTGIGGDYSFEVPVGSYTVAPSQEGYVFTPSIRDVTIADADSPGNDFESLGGGDGTYLVVDLVTGAVANLTLAPPDLPTSTEYKTDKMVFRRIPAGTFTMGSPGDELGRDPDETLHQVTLTKDFYIGVFEVTQSQYQLIMGTNPSIYLGDDRPVEMVSWNAVRSGTWPSGVPAENSFMDKLRTLTGGLLFDLPIEAQWEYACRAGTTRAYNDYTQNGGEGSDCLTTGIDQDTNLDPLAWYTYNNGGSHRAVGTKQANAWGLYDMHGNVWEWCLDWYVADLGVDPVIDPIGGDTGSNRVIRGGSWDNFARYCRSANRASPAPSDTYYHFGFRTAIQPQ
jgi:formylglycine-generating enzyme required for sulfatase activity